MAHPYHVFDAPELHQFVLANYSATISSRPNIGIQTQQLLRRLELIEKVRDASGRGDSLELLGNATEALQEELFSWLDVCAIEEPTISRDDPANVIRTYAPIQKPKTNVHGGLAGSDNDVVIGGADGFWQLVGSYTSDARSHLVF